MWSAWLGGELGELGGDGWGCGEGAGTGGGVWVSVEIGDGGPGFAGEENSGGGVPGLEPGLEVRVETSAGHVAQVERCAPEHLEPVIQKLREAGCHITVEGNGVRCVAAWLLDRGELDARVEVPFHQKNTFEIARVEEAAEMRARYQGDMLHCDRVKVFVDGVLETYTALMLEGYPDQPENMGAPLFSAAELNEIVRRADRHVAGKRTVRSRERGVYRRRPAAYRSLRAM